MFADDLIFFTRANGREIRSIKYILQKYEQWSGQKVNYQKSSVTFSRNTLLVVQTQLCDELGLKKMRLGSKYLGLPLIMPRSKIQVFNVIREKVLKKLAGWQSKVLSQAGRTLLLRSTAAAMPQYHMASLLLPKTWCEELDRHFKNFFWGFGTDGSRHFTPVAWSRICLPKPWGGVGLRKLFDINRALLAKLGWSLLANPDQLWARIIKAKYYRNSTFLSAFFGSRSSWAWQGLIQVRSLIQKGLCWVPSGGSSILALVDPWVPFLEEGKPIGRSDIEQPFLSITMAELFDFDHNYWKQDLIDSLFEVSSAQAICNLDPLLLGAEDSCVWLPDPRGVFTVQSTYNLLKQDAGITSVFEEKDWRFLWQLKIQDRLKLFLWRCALDAFPFRGKIQAIVGRGNDEYGLCPLCSDFCETGLHLFFSCRVAKALWRECAWPLHVEQLPFDYLAQLVRTLSQPHRFLHVFEDRQRDFSLCVAIVLDSIWFWRNRVVHQGLEVDVLKMVRMTHRHYFEHLQAWRISATASSTVWFPPLQGRLKYNVDVAIRGRAAILVAVFRDSGGSLCQMYTEQFPSINSLFGESSSLVAATNIALSMGWKAVDFETDCQGLCAMILDCEVDPGPLLHSQLLVLREFFLIMLIALLCGFPVGLISLRIV
ncbi:hypothetical protein CJ030_MR3G001300 [Morella rubra]|uniref:Reverse transcriptase zinc-binding domain-containing protein n=1 Tax=Morella rubra TaxID=262757 RepID=A0A6A1W543_9ROSI|nr:hypothetical protein CJ030_MR3G001300 [Morella rubra]